VRPDVNSTLNTLSDVPPEENIEAPASSETSVADDGTATSTTTGEPSDSSSTTATTAAG
jgi:hypothetical protein